MTPEPSAWTALLTVAWMSWSCRWESLPGTGRSFRMAGARTVISSLWKVEDASTAELMEGFYRGLWIDGAGKLDALRAAQLALLERNRQEAGEPRPSTWGAFVLGGDWR